MKTQGSSSRSPLTVALRDVRGAFAAVGGFSLFVNVLMLTVPLYMLQVYDRVLTSRSVDTLLMLTILAVALLGLNSLVEMFRSRVLVRVGSRLDEALRGPLFHTMVYARLQSRATSTAQPLRDLEAVRVFLTGNGLLALFDAPWTPIFLVVIFFFHPWLGGIALAGTVLLFSVALAGELATKKLLRESGQRGAEAHGFAEASTRNAEVIHALGMLANVRRHWLDRHGDNLALQAAASERAGLLHALAKFLRPLLQVAILCVGAYLAIQQAISPGVMIATSIIMGRALAPVEAAIGTWRQFVSARQAYRRLQAAMVQSQDGAPTMRLPRPEGRIAVDGVAIRPPGTAKPVVQAVSFELTSGEGLGVIGPSAAGKSSLARALVGIWAPVAGTIRLDGADVATWDRADLGPHIGYLPQDVELFDGTVADNIARLGEPESEAVVAAAKAAGAHEMILRMPNGYDTRIGDGGSILSGGQRQRVGLARALYGGPVLLVLDEPNASLDAEGEEALRRTLAAIKTQGRTTIVVSHKPSVLASMDKLLVLRDGRMEAFGLRREILARLAKAVPPSESAVTQMPPLPGRAAAIGAE